MPFMCVAFQSGFALFASRHTTVLMMDSCDVVSRTGLPRTDAVRVLTLNVPDMSVTIQTALSPFVSTRTTGIEMDSDDGVSAVRAVSQPLTLFRFARSVFTLFMPAPAPYVVCCSTVCSVCDCGQIERPLSLNTGQLTMRSTWLVQKGCFVTFLMPASRPTSRVGLRHSRANTRT